MGPHTFSQNSEATTDHASRLVGSLKIRGTVTIGSRVPGRLFFFWGVQNVRTARVSRHGSKINVWTDRVSRPN
jgi:hypothetical protein